MQSGPFLTPRLSPWLDLVRGLAAVCVVLGHCVQLDLYTGPWPFTLAFQKNAVTVFFVLSGLVIASSAASRPRSLGDFALARASRIVPVAMLGLLVAIVVAVVDARSGQPAFAEHAQWEGGRIVLVALFLSESWTSGFALNPPAWSLAYEVWFYALFAAATYLQGARRIVALAVLALIAGPNILLLLPAWMAGMALCHWRKARAMPLFLAPVMLAVAGFALYVAAALAPYGFAVLHLIAPDWKFGYSLYALTDTLVALAIAGGFMALRTLAERGWVIPAKPARAARALADISFTLYLLHWPLLKVLRMAGVSAGDDPLALAAIVLLVVGWCALLAMLVERRTPTLRRWLDRRLARRRVVTLAA